MATQSSILAWRVPWTEESGRLQAMESQTRLSDWKKKEKTTLSSAVHWKDSEVTAGLHTHGHGLFLRSSVCSFVFIYGCTGSVAVRRLSRVAASGGPCLVAVLGLSVGGLLFSQIMSSGAQHTALVAP